MIRKNFKFNLIFKDKVLLIILIFCIVLKNYRKEKTKVALCVVAKDENKYIKEFIYYYKNLGIKKIFLYDNNNEDGEKFDIILKHFIKNKFVTIVNIRGIIRPQKLAFNDCYNNNKFNYNWIAFLDVDEFLYFSKFKNINYFLSLSKFKNCSSLLINWKYYGDNNNIFYEPKLLRDRFLKPFYFSKKNRRRKLLYSASKTIVRGGLNITWAHFPHYLKDKNTLKYY